jgi:hypothetical protein
MASRTGERRALVSVRKPVPQLIKMLSRYDKRIVDLALAVRNIVLEEAPAASEIVFDANYTISIILTFTGRVKESFCFVTSHLNHVNLVFNRGAELSDPHSLLQGSGKQMRHIQIKKLADLDLPLRVYIQLAIDRSFMMGGTILKEPQVVVKVAKPGKPRRAP